MENVKKRVNWAKDEMKMNDNFLMSKYFSKITTSL